jgi:hypothetical protein
VAQVVECEDLSSVPSTGKKKKGIKKESCIVRPWRIICTFSHLLRVKAKNVR